MNEQPRLELNTEVSHQVLQPTSGLFPAWLEGTLIRNGPSVFGIDGKEVWHWFDGLAMLHAFSFYQGTIVYNNRLLRTEAYEKVYEQGQIDYIGFATDPCRSIFKRFYTAFFSDPLKFLPNANVNVTTLCGRYVALTEVPLPVHFDPKTLDTLGVVDYSDKLPKHLIWNSAHPHLDTQKNESINYYVEYGIFPHYVIYRIPDGSLERQIIAKIPVSSPSYMHSFSVTDKYVVLAEYPFRINSMAPLLNGKRFIDNYQWHPEMGTIFTVIDKATGDLICRLKEKALFSFHHVNAFEEDGQLKIDLIAYDDTFIITALAPYGTGIGNKDFPTPQLLRFTIDLKDLSISHRIITHIPCELPRINPRFDGKPYKYAYATDLREATFNGEARSIYKIEVQTGKFWEWSEADCCPGEPVFIADPDSNEEDDGIILALVLNITKKMSFLLALDSKNFSELARVETPYPIPMGLHGQFYCTCSGPGHLRCPHTG